MKQVYAMHCYDCKRGCQKGKECPSKEFDVAAVDIKFKDGTEATLHDIYEIMFREGNLVCSNYFFNKQFIELDKIDKIEVRL